MHKLKLIIVSFFLSGTAFSMPTDSLFLKAPDYIFPTLTRNQRYEMAEYFKAGKKDSVANVFRKNAILLKYDTALCHIIVKTSASGQIEIKRISNNTIGVIKTINLPLKYSKISFYTEDWKLTNYSTNLPSSEAWIDENKLKEQNTDKQLIINIINKNYYSMWFGNSNELFVKNNVLETLNDEDLKLVKPFFSDTIINIKL